MCHAFSVAISGDRTDERPYSEYWTLIRGTSATGPARSDPNCPNCGALYDVNMVVKKRLYAKQAE